MSLKNKLITPRTGEVVSLAEFKKHIRWSDSDLSEDQLMRSYLDTAATQAELFTERLLRQSTWKTYLDGFERNIKLDKHPIVISGLTVKYYDVDNALQTLSADEYFVHDNGDNELTEIEFYGTMPSLYDKYNVIEIDYVAGYEVVPEQIKTAIMNYASKLFEHREGESNQGALMDFYSQIYHYKIL
jgi:uncharacterized phiE125 gp8 family phage protein